MERKTSVGGSNHDNLLNIVTNRIATTTVAIRPGQGTHCWWCRMKFDADTTPESLILSNGEKEGTFCSLQCRYAYAEDRLKSPDIARYGVALDNIRREIRMGKIEVKPTLPWTLNVEAGGRFTHEQLMQMSSVYSMVYTIKNSINIDFPTNSIPTFLRK